MATANRQSANQTSCDLAVFLLFLGGRDFLLAGRRCGYEQPAGQFLARGPAGNPRFIHPRRPGAHGPDPEQRRELARDPQRSHHAIFSLGHGRWRWRPWPLFYLFVGKDKLEKPRSGIKIERYTLGERILHWYTALLFVVYGHHRLKSSSGAGAADTDFRTLGRFRIPAGDQRAAQLLRTLLAGRDSFGITDLGPLQYPREDRSDLV